jgi:hypothetical protein
MADAVAEVDPQGGRPEQDREDEQPELETGELKEEDRATLSPPGRVELAAADSRAEAQRAALADDAAKADVAG